MKQSREYRLIVRGMTCGHCVDAVTRAAKAVSGVEEVKVDPERGVAVVIGGPRLDIRRVASAVTNAGYPTEPAGVGEAATEKTFWKTPRPLVETDRADADLIVVGGGSAGFAAAIRAHELGARVVIVNLGTIGGTCVNVGCVPSKTLLRAAEAIHRPNHTRFAGIHSSARLADFSAVIREKDALVGSLRQVKYVDVLESYDGIRLVKGKGVFLSADTLDVRGRKLRAPRIIIATGSRPRIPPIPGLREARPLTSTTAFELDRLPRSMIVLGGRYIALECGQMFARLGAEVTILQRSEHILPTEDTDLAEALTGYLRQEGIRIETSVKIEAVSRKGGQVEVQAFVRGEKRVFHAESVLCAMGREPNTDGMGLENVGIALDSGGHIQVDEYLRTDAPGVFAAGDVIGEPCFVYTAAYEGKLAAQNALSEDRQKRDYTALPWVIFTDPQLAGVGLNEKQAVQAGVGFETARLELSHVPRALAAKDTRGFIKLVKERGTDRLLGARVLAPEGGEQIMEAVMAIRFGIGVSELAEMFHPYLTQSEGIKLCAQTFTKDVRKLSCCS